MQCRQCGTEIAEKALICYRCGAATTDPVFRPPAAPRRIPWMIVLAVVLLLIALAVGAWFALGSRGAGTTGRMDQLPNYQITQLPNYQVTQLSNASET